jgi:hypothetical protein
MFRENWPTGYDAIFLSNILHDWDFDTASILVQKAYGALPPGGQVLIHEMLLDDSHDGPPTAAAFSFYMLVGTKGQQFTASELSSLLEKVGFSGASMPPRTATMRWFRRESEAGMEEFRGKEAVITGAATGRASFVPAGTRSVIDFLNLPPY